MTLAQRVSRFVVAAAAVAVVALLAMVQIGSDALYARDAAPNSLAARVPAAVGVGIYRLLDRIAPAGYVEDALGSYALAHGNSTLAQHYAVRMPASSRRDRLLARIAQARGETVLANEYFFVADDIDELQRSVAKEAATNIYGAIAFEKRIRARLIALQTHPDAVANSYWISGNYETWLHRYADALPYFERAESLAPLDARYILMLGNDALLAGDTARARAAFQHGARVDPGSADMLCGLGLVAAREGRRALAQSYLAQARQMNPHAQMLGALERALR